MPVRMLPPTELQWPAGLDVRAGRRMRGAQQKKRYHLTAFERAQTREALANWPTRDRERERQIMESEGAYERLLVEAAIREASAQAAIDAADGKIQELREGR